MNKQAEEVPQELEQDTPVMDPSMAKDETKTDNTEDKEAPVDQEKLEEKADGPGKIFEFADVRFSCSVCGNDSLIANALRGVSFTVPAAENAEVRMECTECGAILKLSFKESGEEVIAAKKEEAKAQEAEMKAQMEKKEEDNGTDQESTDEAPTQGTADNTERPTKVDPEADGNPASVDGAGQAVEA